MQTSTKMLWTNGVETEVIVNGDRITTVDRHEGLDGGERVVERSVDEILNLIDEHENLNTVLRAAVRQAWSNREAKGSAT